MPSTATITRPVSAAAATLALTVAANVGTQLQLACVVKDGSSNTLTGRSVVWTSATPAVATVDQTGLVTPLTAGSSVITATSGAASDTCTVTVV